MNTENINLNLINNCYKSIKYIKQLQHFTYLQKSDSLNILYVNAISLINKLNDLTLFIDSLSCKVDVIVVTETRLTDNDQIFFQIEGYDAYFNNRNVSNLRKRGGGIAMYIRSSISSSVVKCVFEEKNHFLIVKLNDLNLHIFSVYKPPNTNEKIFISKLEELLPLYKNCIIIGDFNLNILNADDANILNYMNTVHCNGFGFLNKIDSTSATRTTQNSNTIIDHLISDMFNQEYEILVDDVYFSDHKFILTSMNKSNKKQEFNNLKYKKVLDYESLNKHPIWSELDNIVSFEELILKLSYAIEQNMKMIQIKTIKSRNPWVTQELLDLMKQRNKFYKYKKKYKNDSYVESKYSS